MDSHSIQPYTERVPAYSAIIQTINESTASLIRQLSNELQLLLTACKK